MAEPTQAAAPAPLTLTFRPEEVDAALTIFSKLSKGEDTSIVARSRTVQALYAKFMRLRESAIAPREKG